MKIVMVILSIINGILFVLLSLGLFAASSFGGDSTSKTGTISLIIIAGVILCIILPWLLNLTGRNRAASKASIMKWAGFVLMVLPVTITILWVSTGAASGGNAITKPPTSALSE